MLVQNLSGACTSPFPSEQPAQSHGDTASQTRPQQPSIQVEAEILGPLSPPRAFSLTYECSKLGLSTGYAKCGLIIVSIPPGASHMSVIQCFDVVVGANGVRFHPQSTQEQRIMILKNAPCPKVVNFERYGDSSAVSENAMKRVLNLHTRQPLPPQPLS